MKVGVRAHDFGRLEVGELARRIKAAGFECVQLAPAKAIQNVEKFADITPRVLADISREFSAADVELTVLGCYIEPSVPDKDARLQNVKIFCDNLHHAKELGISVVGTETTHFPIDATPEERERVYLLLKDSVLRMVEVAEKTGVNVGIEPVAEHTLNTPALTRRLLDEVQSDRLKIIFDPVNLLLPATFGDQQRIFAEAFDAFGEEIVALHVKDIVIEKNEKAWRNIGAGGVQYGQILPWLRQHKPEMRLLREGVAMDSYKICRRAMEEMI
jgi:sugar phosphate isomerase/epimerase